MRQKCQCCLVPTASLTINPVKFRIAFALSLTLSCVAQSPMAPRDLLQMKSIGSTAVSPDGAHVAYAIRSTDDQGRGHSQLVIMDIASGRTSPIAAQGGGDFRWSPDGKWIAFSGSFNGKQGLCVTHSDGTGTQWLADMQESNTPMQMLGNDIAWSPDSQRIAFVSATEGPEQKAATGDPVVITRYLYKPDASEGETRFGDNRRLHIFTISRTGGAPEQLTSGDNYQHSIDWSPDGREILFVSNTESDADQFFNSDVFAVRPSDKSLRRITATESAEYQPQWSPDGKQILFLGTRRGLTDLETTMEDTHVWVMNADGSNRREIGAAIDNRQIGAHWSRDGQSILTGVMERGDINIWRIPLSGAPQRILTPPDHGFVFDVGETKSGLVFTGNSAHDAGQLYLQSSSGAPKKLTDPNVDYFRTHPIARVEAFQFLSNDFKFNVEAFLTVPSNLEQTPNQKHPMIVLIHGGPHGMQGAALNFRAQAYAARGWATLMVNYRGSTGYGQKFTDAVFRDQNGDEGQDVLYAVSAAVRRYPWIDRDRLGIEGVSYGGQLTAWLTTQTNEFKAAIPTSAIINNISYNYMTYYNQYEAMEWGAYPHQGNLMDVLWERSALKHVAACHTPTMIVHGENDNDVPIAEAEQWFIALKDVGTEAIMVRYPHEGHGVRKPLHQIDYLVRSIDWYEKHFAITGQQPTAVIP